MKAAIKVGEHQEVSLEVLLAKLGIVQTVLAHTTAYVERTRSSCENIFIPPENSILDDAKTQLEDVLFAIKCECRGLNAPGIVRTIVEVTDTTPLEGALQ